MYALLLLQLFPAWAAAPRSLARQPDPSDSVVHRDDAPRVATGTLYGLVVGINDFRSPGIDDLQYAERDAELFQTTLRTRGLQPEARQDIVALRGTDATRKAVRDAYEERLGRAGPNDLVVLYLSTHGVALGGEGYLVAWDSDPANDLDNLRFTGLALRDLDAAVERSAAGMIVVVLDACHSGLAGGGADEPFNPGVGRRTGAKKKGVMFLSGALAADKALEGPEWCADDGGGGHGAFTCELTNALRGGADVDASGLVTLGEVAVKVPERVYNATRDQQIAVPTGTYDGAFPLARTDWSFEPPRAPDVVERKRSWPLLAGAGGAIAAAGAAGIAAWATDRAYADAPDRESADELRSANHASIAGVGVFAAGAATFAIWAGVRGEW